MRENIVEFQFELQKHMVLLMKNTGDLEFVLYVSQCQIEIQRIFEDFYTESKRLSRSLANVSGSSNVYKR